MGRCHDGSRSPNLKAVMSVLGNEGVDSSWPQQMLEDHRIEILQPWPMTSLQLIEKRQEVLKRASHAETSTKRKVFQISSLSRCFQAISLHHQATFPMLRNSKCIKPQNLFDHWPILTPLEISETSECRLIGDAFFLTLQQVIHLELPQIKADLLGRCQQALHGSQLTEADSSKITEAAVRPWAFYGCVQNWGTIWLWLT